MVRGAIPRAEMVLGVPVHGKGAREENPTKGHGRNLFLNAKPSKSKFGNGETTKATRKDRANGNPFQHFSFLEFHRFTFHFTTTTAVVTAAGPASRRAGADASTPSSRPGAVRRQTVPAPN